MKEAYDLALSPATTQRPEDLEAAGGRELLERPNTERVSLVGPGAC